MDQLIDVPDGVGGAIVVVNGDGKVFLWSVGGEGTSEKLVTLLFLLHLPMPVWYRVVEGYESESRFL